MGVPMTDAFQEDIQSLYRKADQATCLPEVIPALLAVFRSNEAALAGITHSYRIHATDSGFTAAFTLTQGRFGELAPEDAADVTVLGSEADLLSVFQRKLSPMSALLRGKVRLQGSKAALLQLAAFL